MLDDDHRGDKISGSELIDGSKVKSGRPAGRPRNSLDLTLKTLLERSGKSIYQLSNESGVDAAYIWRILRGERQNVSREILIALSIALVSESGHSERVFEVANELLDAAGFKELR